MTTATPCRTQYREVLRVAETTGCSARNQTFQADTAEHSAAPLHHLPKLTAKEVGDSTWILGTFETIAVIVVMIAGYRALRAARRPPHRRGHHSADRGARPRRGMK